MVAVLTPLFALTAALAHAQGVWLTLPPMPTARSFLGAAAAPCPHAVPGLRESCVYAVGGYDGTNDLNTLEAYSPATNSWVTLPPMPTARRLLAAAAAPCPRNVAGLRGTCVYAIGGFHGVDLNTVEAYSPATNTWATLPPMPTARENLAASTAPCPRGVAGLRGTCVFAIGGRNSAILDTVEAYSPETDTWATLPSMPTARVALAAATSDCPRRVPGLRETCVYAVGGNNGSAVLDTVEAYSPATDSWAALPSMPTARFDLAAAAARCPDASTDASRGACLYAVGGINTVALNTFEDYSPARNAWTALPPMPTARDSLGAASAPCPDAPHRTCVYEVGGENAASTPLNTLEAFEIDEGHHP
ncbi:hypothetical protein AAW14_11415 [Streptomyces hygroscopicus]|uniref:Kelch repeat-containing protein n=1 Tax=Streptomyces hygroscopicus TaxID=1912 RepID=UPI00223FB5AD|nr:kelch repeat-containing protein [Streptomyces hygroscopicus]MCW7942644.1 hypothetical protein [Streptomyces hygroscopicus]